jgi:hypothetical protein
VDAVYEAFGKVLTISGRTIREDAQRSPAIVKQAQDALEGLLAEVGGLCVWGGGGGGVGGGGGGGGGAGVCVCLEGNGERIGEMAGGHVWERGCRARETAGRRANALDRLLASVGGVPTFESCTTGHAAAAAAVFCGLQLLIASYLPSKSTRHPTDQHAEPFAGCRCPRSCWTAPKSCARSARPWPEEVDLLSRLQGKYSAGAEQAVA